MYKKALIVDEYTLKLLKPYFNLKEMCESNKYHYTSPNGYIERSISLNEIEEYRTSNFSLPMTDLSAYEKIAEDILDYKRFMDSFHLEDFSVAIERVMEEFKKNEL